MTILSGIRTSIAADIRDPSFQTFSQSDINDWVATGMAELSTFSPILFQQDITPVIGQIIYPLQVPDRRTSVLRVEIWDITQSPIQWMMTVNSSASAIASITDSGWECWNGSLWLPWQYVTGLDPASYLIRVWGYQPHAIPILDTDVLDTVDIEELAIRQWAMLQAYQRLLNDRALFSQWQTTPSNTGVTVATLMGVYNSLLTQWRLRKRELRALRAGS